MNAGEIAPLSAESERQLLTLYRPEDRADVRNMLLELMQDRFGAPERVRYDVLHLGAGDPLRVRALVNLAKLDPRDVMAMEYSSDGRPHSWALQHAVNRSMSSRDDF